MLETEKLKYLVAFIKMLDGEALSFQDAERLIMFFATNPPAFSTPSTDEVAGLKNRMLQAIEKTYKSS